MTQGGSSQKARSCAYCGKSFEALTKDHIISRGLFIKPYPANLPTVKVCEPCNQEKGRNEDYLRDFLILNVEAAHNVTASTLKATTLIRAIGTEEHGNTSKIVEALVVCGRLTNQYTPKGIFVRQAFTVPTNVEKRETVLSSMIRGFHFKLFHTILPASHEIQMVWVDETKVRETWQSFLEKNAQIKSWGDVFSYQCLPTEDQSIVAWLFLFYQTILFQCLTYPAP